MVILTRGDERGLLAALSLDEKVRLLTGADNWRTCPLHAIGPSTFLSADHVKRLAEADVILSLDWVDLAGILRSAWPDGRPSAKVIRDPPDQYSHGGR